MFIIFWHSVLSDSHVTFTDPASFPTAESDKCRKPTITNVQMLTNKHSDIVITLIQREDLRHLFVG